MCHLFTLQAAEVAVDKNKHGHSPADYDSKAADGTEVGPEASGGRDLDMNEPFVSGPAYFLVVGAAYPKVYGLPALSELPLLNPIIISEEGAMFQKLWNSFFYQCGI